MESTDKTITVPKAKFLTTEEAAKWLGVRESLFADVMAHHRMEPVQAWKGKKMWPWAAVWYAEELIKAFKGVEK